MDAIHDIVLPAAPAVAASFPWGLVIASAVIAFGLLLAVYSYRRRLNTLFRLYLIEHSAGTWREKVSQLYNIMSPYETALSTIGNARGLDWQRYFIELSAQRFGRGNMSDESWKSLLRQSRQWALHVR